MRLPLVLALVGTLVCAGCWSSSLRPETHDAGSPSDAPVIARDAGTDAPPPRDAGADAGPDAGDDDRCFDDIELVVRSGGREHFAPAGLLAYDGGWIAIYDASSHEGPSERAVTFFDRDGRVTGRQRLGVDDANGPRAVLGRYLLTAQYDRTFLYEIGDGELVDRSELLAPTPPGRIAVVEPEGDRLRVLSATWIDPTARSFRFAYSEITLGPDGMPITTSVELPAVETLGAPALLDGLSRYHAIHSFALHQDTLLLAFPTGEREYDVTGQPWNVVRLALERAGRDGAVVGWSVIDDTRWENGPVAVFGALSDLDLAIAGRFGPAPSYAGALSAESFVDPTAPRAHVGDFPAGEVGPASVVRRGDVVAIATAQRFRVLSLPTLAERASVALELAYGMAAWGEEQVLEVGSVRDATGLRGLVRCHDLRP